MSELLGSIRAFGRTRWGAAVLWVLVLYASAFVWDAVDTHRWWAFPTYVITVLVWVGSLFYLLSFFLEWTGDRVALRHAATDAGAEAPPSSDEVTRSE